MTFSVTTVKQNIGQNGLVIFLSRSLIYNMNSYIKNSSFAIEHTQPYIEKWMIIIASFSLDHGFPAYFTSAPLNNCSDHPHPTIYNHELAFKRYERKFNFLNVKIFTSLQINKNTSQETQFIPMCFPFLIPKKIFSKKRS